MFRNKFGNKIMILALGLALVFASSHQAEAWFFGSGTKAVKTPFPLPSLSLKTLINGDPLVFDELHGKVILVNFWATWCKPCVEEMPALNRIFNELQDQNFTIIGVSMDSGSSKPVKTLTKKMKIAYPIVMGGNKAAKKFGEIIGIPVTFLVDRNGTVVKRYDGPREYEVFLKDIKELL